MTATTPSLLRPESSSSAAPRIIAIGGLVVLVGVLGFLGQSLSSVGIIVILVVAVVAVSLLLRRPDQLVPIMVFSMWFEAFSVGQISTGSVLGALTAVIIGARMLTSSWRPPMLMPRAWLAVFLLTWWAWFGGVYALTVSGPAGWFQQFLVFFLGVLYWAAMAVFVEGPEQMERLLKIFLWIGVPIAALGTLIFFTLGNRVFGLTGGPNTYAGYVVLMFPIIVLFARRAEGRMKWAYWALIPVYVGGLVSTGSRSGIVSAALMGAYILITIPGLDVRRRVNTLVFGTLGMGLLYLLAAILQPERFAPQVIFGQGDRGAGRFDVWEAGTQAIADNWRWGLGLGGFASNSLYFIQTADNLSIAALENSTLVEAGGISSHNLYLQLILDTGIVGTILYVSVFGLTLWNLWTLRNTRWGDLAWVFGGIVLATMARGWFGAFIGHKMFWVVVGATSAAFVRRRLTPTREQRARAALAESESETDQSPEVMPHGAG